VSESKKTPTWLFFLVGIVILGGLVGGAVYYDWLWHVWGDKAAETEGVLLSFIASGATALTTLAFIYLTRRSLEAAQDAISLQRDSLDATRQLISVERDSLQAAQDATNLEREKWARQLDVQPRFWLQRSENEEGWVRVNYVSDVPGHNPYGSIPPVKCYVWNPNQQSFRVISIKMWSSANRTISAELEVPCTVVAPNSVVPIDITAKLPRILFRDVRNGPYRREALVNPYEQITVVLVFDWWKSSPNAPDEKEAYFRLQTDGGLEALSIRAQQSPFN
jgi:hypothetical protein